MKWKLYVLKENNAFKLVAGQGLNPDKVKIKLAPIVQASSKLTSIEKGTFLVIVDLDNEEITEIISVLPTDKWVSNDMLNEIKNFNKAAKDNIVEKAELKYPIPDNLFIDELTWRFITASLDVDTYPFLIGPKGCGKTQTAISVAEVMGYKFYPINCGAIFKPKSTLVGTVHAKDGSTFLVPAEFLTHFTSTEPTIIFLDEVPRILPGASNYFMTILDQLEQYIYVEEQGKRLFKGENVKFMAAGNFGFEYTDTRNLDGAFADRFVKFTVNYLPPDKEYDLIMQRVPGSNSKHITTLIKNANICRKQVEQLKVGVSTRQLIIMAKFLKAGFTPYEVMHNIFLNLFYNGSMDDRELVDKMIHA